MGKLPVPMPPPGEMLQRRKSEIRKHRRIRRLCLLAAAFWILFSQVLLFHPYQGIGMYPSLRDGDLVLANRIWPEYEKGDLVVYRLNGQLCLGRIGAVAKDAVMMDDSGALLVNGSIQNAHVLFPTYARADSSYPVQVPEGMVFLLGDHRTKCSDSRDHGCVALEDLLGKVIAVLRVGEL